ncbi:hypothetical protein [Noviherbaspirillum sedimenti]|nr:hypothetical protein [Noviherbaspirillum sedimenti]
MGNFITQELIFLEGRNVENIGKAGITPAAASPASNWAGSAE